MLESYCKRENEQRKCLELGLPGHAMGSEHKTHHATKGGPASPGFGNSAELSATPKEPREPKGERSAGGGGAVSCFAGFYGLQVRIIFPKR